MYRPNRLRASRFFHWLIGTAVILFWGCRTPKPDKIELTFWAMGAEGEKIEQLLPAFEQAHPGIRVKVQTIPWSAAHEKLLTAFVGGANPDVCQLGNTWIPEFRAIDALIPLDSLLARSASLDSSWFFQGVWDTNVLDGNVYGIPWYVDTRLLFYRTDILRRAGYQEPPQTWEQWLELAQKIKQQAHDPAATYAVFFSLIFNDWQIPVIFIMQNGGKLLRDNDCYGAFDDPATMAAMRYYLSFFEKNLAPHNMTEASNIYQAFETAYVAMIVTGPWNVNEIRRRSPALQGRWSTAPMPRKQNRASVAGGASLVIFKGTPHSEQAWQLIEYLTDPATQVAFFRLTTDLPAVRQAWQTPEILADPQIRAFYQQLENVMPTPKIAEWEQIAVKIQEHLERVVFKKTTLEAMVKDLNRDVDHILEKRRWLVAKNLLPAGE